jgi:hypothetical protein
MTALTLVSGADYAGREAEIAIRLASLPVTSRCAAILEGLPQGQMTLLSAPMLQVHRLAPACMCCIGNLSLRVTLNRILREPPAHLFLALATVSHLENILAMLQQAPYDGLLQIREHLQLPTNNL